VWSSDPELLDGFPSSRCNRDFEGIAEQPTEALRFTCFCDDTIKQFIGWIFEYIFQWTACEQPEKFGVIRSRGTKNHIHERLFRIVMKRRVDLSENVGMFFWPIATSIVLNMVSINIELMTHLSGIRACKCPFQFIKIGFRAHAQFSLELIASS